MFLQRHLHHLLVLVVTSLWPCMHADFRFISYEGESSLCSFWEKVTSRFISVGGSEFRVNSTTALLFGLSPVNVRGSETWLVSGVGDLFEAENQTGPCGVLLHIPVLHRLSGPGAVMCKLRFGRAASSPTFRSDRLILIYCIVLLSDRSLIVTVTLRK
jgi:hypothetical protein